jgi:hypothetical protein
VALSANDIKKAFDALSDELARENRRAEVAIAGGAAMVLLFHARETTKDVDAYFLSPEAAVVREAAERVASQLNLPGDWLNDGAKGYFVGVTTGEVLFESKSLLVRAVSTAQLLAMKLAAWRDAVDRADAQLLLAQISGSAEDIWAAIKPFVPAHNLDKASYALEDLWEATHGAS